ncbi:MAG: nuclear transport factor 2 family protein [Daejeonella sp.]
MKQYTILTSIALFLISSSFAQVSNGEVSSLVAAENYFAATVKEKGLREGFLKVSDSKTLVFRPNPVNAEDFYSKKQGDPGELIWEPSYARISRSGDWGFTTGPYVYTSGSDSTKSYGQYLSIWQANKKYVWKLALDIGTPHGKPLAEPVLNFTDAKNFKFFRQISQARLKQREDMIMTTDRLFSNTLKKNLPLAYNTFLGEEARLIFPGFEPIAGKENISKFYEKQEVDIVTEPALANRSIGSDLAYTYGIAQVTQNNKTAKYNYVRIWESQEGFKWNVIVELFSPAVEL